MIYAVRLSALMPSLPGLVVLLFALSLVSASHADPESQSNEPQSNEPQSNYEPRSKARVLSEPKPLQAFTLIDHQGQPLTPESFRGHWSWLFFGYTHCPDVCPVTLAELGRLFRQLRREGDLITSTRAVFVSVDPARDTPETLANYVHYFDNDFIGATGSPEALDELTGQLNIKHSRGETTRTGYTVNHTSAVLLIDPQARYYAYVLPPHYAEDLYYHYTAIRDYYDERSIDEKSIDEKTNDAQKQQEK